MFRVLILVLSCMVSAMSQPVAPVLHPDIDQPARKGEILVQVQSETVFVDWVKTFHPGWQTTVYGVGLVGVRTVGRGIKSKLKYAPGLKFADIVDRKAAEESLPGEFDHTLNGVVAAHTRYPMINGSNIRLSIKEKPFNISDIDLRGRILAGPFDEPPTDHATFMATIAAGAGNTSEFTTGGAWGAQITTSDYDRLLPDPDVSLRSSGISVQNHSYGVGVENYYGIESNEYDRQSIALPGLLHVFSAGNKGNATTTGGPYSGVTGFANLTGQ